MKIAITSGKGGSGKTLITASLAATLAGRQKVSVIDCDVEAPNMHLLIQPENSQTVEEKIESVDRVNPDKCTACRKCAEVCYFNAVVVTSKQAMVFPELCRACGACIHVCPTGAIETKPRLIGRLHQTRTNDIDLHWATLETGAAGMTVRLIEKLKKRMNDGLWLLDSPPGTSCAVVNTIQDADRVILVGDPSPFGMHDLSLSVRLCHSMGITPEVIINRVGIADIHPVTSYCKENDAEIIGFIPDDIRIAQAYSKGELAIETIPEVRDLFEELADRLMKTPPPKITLETLDEDEGFVVPENYLPKQDQQALAGPPTAGANKPKEITIVSGKGGTGKTSLSACFAQLCDSLIADCDVDAADLHLILSPQTQKSGLFFGGRVMTIDPDLCKACGRCLDACTFHAIHNDGKNFQVNHAACEGCGACMVVCPYNAVTTEPTLDGRWILSDTRFGPMSHAELEPGRENSGKLVSIVRKNLSISDEPSPVPAILDGSPGTGCPVIASITASAGAVVVTEPTVSGLHDLKRILDLCRHFRITAGVIINKADINPQVNEQIEQYLRDTDTALLGCLDYDNDFHRAQENKQTLLEYAPDSATSRKIREIWQKIMELFPEALDNVKNKTNSDLPEAVNAAKQMD